MSSRIVVLRADRCALTSDSGDIDCELFERNMRTITSTVLTKYSLSLLEIDVPGEAQPVSAETNILAYITADPTFAQRLANYRYLTLCTTTLQQFCVAVAVLEESQRTHVKKNKKKKNTHTHSI